MRCSVRYASPPASRHARPSRRADGVRHDQRHPGSLPDPGERAPSAHVRARRLPLGDLALDRARRQARVEGDGRPRGAVAPFHLHRLRPARIGPIGRAHRTAFLGSLSRAMCCCRRATMSRGVGPGTSRPYQVVMSKPASPDSATVGSCGAMGERCGLVTASARSRASARYGRLSTRFMKYTGTDALGELLAEGARQDVGRAPGLERNDNAQRPAWKALRLRECGQDQSTSRAPQAHGRPPFRRATRACCRTPGGRTRRRA